MNVLLVDDIQANLVALKAVISDAQFHLFTATSGEEALKITLREDISVIILDVVLPGMDGFEVAEHLQQVERTRKIPVLFVTAAPLDADKAYRAYEFGAVDCMVRPIDPVALRMKIAVLANLVRQREEIERQAATLREADLKRHEHELAQLRAERTSQLGEELLAIVAHDLRNPLGAIKMNAGSLARGDGPIPRELGVKASKAILKAAERMDRLIGDLLDIAQLKAGKMVLERKQIDGAGVIKESLELFKPLADEKQLRLEGEAEALWVVGDRDRVLQVLSNLIGNALKFTPSPGTIVLRVHRENDEAVFTVSDSGPGMTSEDAARIWDRYWQSKQRSAGIGLGLSIARGLVEAQGGRIWAESRPGSGAAFHFTLPLTEPEVEQPAAVH